MSDVRRVVDKVSIKSKGEAYDQPAFLLQIDLKKQTNVIVDVWE